MTCSYCGHRHAENFTCQPMRQIMDDARAGVSRPSSSNWPSDVQMQPGDSRRRDAGIDSPVEKSGEGPTPRVEKLHRVLYPESALSAAEHHKESIWRLALDLERSLSAAIERERLANMRADQAEEAAQSATQRMGTIYVIEGKPHRLCDCRNDTPDCPHGRTRSFLTVGYGQCLVPALDVFPICSVVSNDKPTVKLEDEGQ